MQILSGAVIVQGESHAVVTATGPHSFFGKTIKLLGKSGQERGHLYKVRSGLNLSKFKLLYIYALSQSCPLLLHPKALALQPSVAVWSSSCWHGRCASRIDQDKPILFHVCISSPQFHQTS